MWKKLWPYVMFGTFCFAFTLGLLLFHHIPDNYSEKKSFNYTLYAHYYAVLNYDSPEFLKDSTYPIELLEKTSIRQSRPGLILLVAGLNKVALPFRNSITHLFRASGTEIPKEEIVPYVLYVFLNYLFLFLSFFIFMRILLKDVSFVSFSVIFLGGLFVFNDLLKAFLLTPHTQIFNLLAPLVCLYTFQEIKNHNLFDSGKIFVLAFLVGLGMTAYGSFILFIPSVIIALGLVTLKNKAKISKRLIYRLLLVIILTIAPFLTWMLYVYMMIGSFYQFEIVNYHQFVWIIPMLRSTPVGAVVKIVNNLIQLVKSAVIQAIILPLIIICICLITVDKDHRILQQLNRIRKFPLGALFISGLFLVFFALAGLPADRVAFAAVPPLVIGTAIVVNDLLKDVSLPRQRLGNLVVIFLVALDCTYVLFKIGPFS
jgi:hypothetical protein